MRTLTDIFESLVSTYNQKQTINFIDLRDFEKLFFLGAEDNEIYQSLIKSYNENLGPNFLDLRRIEQTIKQNEREIQKLNERLAELELKKAKLFSIKKRTNKNFYSPNATIENNIEEIHRLIKMRETGFFS